MITKCNHTSAKLCAKCAEENRFEQLKSDLRKLVADMRDDKDYGRHWGTSMHWADEIEKLLNGGE